MLLHPQAEALDQIERPEILSLLPSFTHQSVLDLGAGIGRFTSAFAKEAKYVTALDFCPHFLEANRQANAPCSNIEYLCLDILDADFKPRSFDLIFISWLFMYLTDPEIVSLATRMTQWLKPGGHLFFRESCAYSTHFSQTDGYYAHYRSMADYETFFPSPWLLINQGSVQAYENLLAAPFKCFWLYKIP